MAPNTETEWITLARIARTQGRKGEVLADLFTDFPDRFKTRKSVTLLSPAGVRTAHTVESFWLPTGRSAGRIVFKLSAIDDMNAAEKLAGFTVQIVPEERVPLDAATWYVSDLVGCEVTDEGNPIGIVLDVHFPANTDGKRLEAAAPILVVQRGDGDEVMVPLALTHIVRIATGEKKIEMRLPVGLLDING